MENEENKTQLVIIAPLPNLKERVRLNKLAGILLNSNKLEDLDIVFWGWDRGINCGIEDYEQIDKKIILKGGGEGNKLLVFFYFLWIIKIFIYILLKGNKHYYYCLGFDTALPASLASLIVKRNFVYDNADNISKSYKWPKPIEKVIVFLEKFCANRAAIHLVPGRSRIEEIEKNTKIIPNTPTSFLLERAKKIACERDYKKGKIFTVYINGYLTKERGINQIYNAVKKCQNNKINVIIAGYLRCEAANKLIELSNVKYYGQISNEEALALYYNSHLAITYYDPSIKVNQLAEPNKWGDCIATQTPFLTNIEILTAKPYFEKKACLGLPYYDIDSMVDLLNELSNDLSKLKPINDNIKKFRFDPWDIAMKDLLENFISLD